MSNHDQTNQAVSIHQYSTDNRESLSASDTCGCFHCLEEYNPNQITDWTDNGNTAICPHCGIDSVIAQKDIEFDQELLKQMQDYWFADQ